MNVDKDFSKIVSDEIDTEPGVETQLSDERLDSFTRIDEDNDISPYNSMNSSVEVPVNDMISKVTNEDDNETNDETITDGRQDEVQAGVQEVPLAEGPSEEGYEQISNEEVPREANDVNDEGVTNIEDREDVNEMEDENDVADEDVQCPKSNEDDVTDEDVGNPKSNEDDVTDEDVKTPKLNKKFYFLVVIIVVFGVALAGTTLYKTKTISRQDDGSAASSGGKTESVVDDELLRKQQEEEQQRQAEEEEKWLREEAKRRWYKIGGGITILAVIGAGFYLKMGNASPSAQGNRQQKTRPNRDDVAKRQLHKYKNQK